jgi:hypothetical protein
LAKPTTKALTTEDAEKQQLANGNWQLAKPSAKPLTTKGTEKQQLANSN